MTKKFWNGKEVNEKNLVDIIKECSENNWKNSDLFIETEIACEILAFEDYKGRNEDIEYILEKLEDGATLFHVEDIICTGQWYFDELMRMKKLLKKAEASIDKELEENIFIEDTAIIGWESRYLDNLALKLATKEILGDDIYEKDDKFRLYDEKEDEILELTDILLEKIEEKIMTKYNCYEDSIYLKVYYKIDKKFNTREECLDFFEIDY